MTAFTAMSPFGVEAHGIELSQPVPDGRFAELERAFYVPKAGGDTLFPTSRGPTTISRTR